MIRFYKESKLIVNRTRLLGVIYSVCERRNNSKFFIFDEKKIWKLIDIRNRKLKFVYEGKIIENTATCQFLNEIALIKKATSKLMIKFVQNVVENESDDVYI